MEHVRVRGDGVNAGVSEADDAKIAAVVTGPRRSRAEPMPVPRIVQAPGRTEEVTRRGRGHVRAHQNTERTDGQRQQERSGPAIPTPRRRSHLFHDRYSGMLSFATGAE